MKKNGKFAKRGIATKAMVMILAVMMIVGISVGGTLAWITAQTQEVKNTFTVGDINIELWEDKLQEDGSLDENTPVAENEYTFVPGDTLNKRPYVLVEADSEACWLFVKITPVNNTVSGLNGEVIAWAIDNGWTALEGETNVWYKELAATTADTQIDILMNDQVTVNENLTKAMINAEGYTAPTLTFTAYAVQKAHIDTAAAAWAEVSGN